MRYESDRAPPGCGLVFVGEAPNARGDGVDVPLEGRPVGVLASLLGVTRGEAEGSLEFANLLERCPTGAFPVGAGRIAARAFVMREDRRYVLLGEGVRASFGIRADFPILHWLEVRKRRSCASEGVVTRVALVPHPSGLNRWYNAGENVARVSAFLREALAAPDTPTLARSTNPVLPSDP